MTTADYSLPANKSVHNPRLTHRTARKRGLAKRGQGDHGNGFGAQGVKIVTERTIGSSKVAKEPRGVVTCDTFRQRII